MQQYISTDRYYLGIGTIDCYRGMSCLTLYGTCHFDTIRKNHDTNRNPLRIISLIMIIFFD